MNAVDIDASKGKFTVASCAPAEKLLLLQFHSVATPFT